MTGKHTTPTETGSIPLPPRINPSGPIDIADYAQLPQQRTARPILLAAALLLLSAATALAATLI